MQPLRTRLVAAGVLAALAFLLYVTTLLPGQDLGDTASFQAIVGDQLLVPRQGYPLYFALNGALARLLPVEAARAANLGSAIAAAAAVGLMVLVGAELAGTLAAGLVAGLLLAGSYTFWSQAVIAEVYALHLLLASACLLALLAWKARPSTARLALFFALCALGFGNHLSMVLLLPGFALLLVTAAPEGPRSMLRPRVATLAAAMAALFALQYAWNIRWLVAEHPNAAVADLARTFWFDVTKSDWRANMVYGIPTSTLADRFAMYWFDVRQQFGIPGAVAAIVGFAALLRQQWRLGVMLLTLWFVNWVFAFTYNVGDVHVFYLGSHWAAALAAGCGAGWAVSTLQARQRGAAATLAALVLLAYPAWRAWDTYPAMDRSDDREPTLALDRLIAGMDTDREVLGTRPELAAPQRPRLLRQAHAARPRGVRPARHAAVVPVPRLQERGARTDRAAHRRLRRDGPAALRRALRPGTGSARARPHARRTRRRRWPRERPTCCRSSRRTRKRRSTGPIWPRP